MKVYKCIRCGKISEWHRSKTNKYCGNKCQALYQSEQKILEWQSGNLDNPPRFALKRYLMDKQSNRCSVCEMENMWQGKEIVFVMDHIDGNSKNNVEENLRLVCPNCDSQLPTFKNRNHGNGRYSRRDRYKKGKSY